MISQTTTDVDPTLAEQPAAGRAEYDEQLATRLAALLVAERRRRETEAEGANDE